MATCAVGDVTFGSATDFLTTNDEKVYGKFVTLFDAEEQEESLSRGQRVEDALGEGSEDKKKLNNNNITVQDYPDIPVRTSKIFYRGSPTVVIVQNISPKTTQNCLRNVFKKYGEVVSVRLNEDPPPNPVLDKKPIMKTLNGVIKFVKREDAKKAQKLNGYKLNGRRLRVIYVRSDRRKDNPRTIFVGNLGFAAEESALEKCFGECGDVESVYIVRDANTGSGKGYGFVKFESESSVTTALEMGRPVFAGRTLRISRMPTQTSLKKYSGTKRANKSDNTDKGVQKKRMHFKMSRSGADDFKSKPRLPLKRRKNVKDGALNAENKISKIKTSSDSKICKKQK